jgi:glycosyltransferase involved in cell wall biosynthesis
MRVLLYSRHEYPARREDGAGREPRPEPSGAAAHVLDVLARGLAEEGHEVHYLLPAGTEGPLPEGVARARGVDAAVDVFHNVEVASRPWLTTIHGYRPPAAYFDRVLDGELVPAAGRGASPPYELPANSVCVSRTLAATFGSSRYVHNGLDPADFIYSETKGDHFLFIAGMQGPSIHDIYRHKGLELALELATEVGFQLLVAGTTRERVVGDRIASMCHDAGARYLGDVRGREKAELLAGARAVLFPTRLHEGCPLVIIEALLSGTPVIASNRGACPELVSPEVGFVCADRAAFRRAIEGVGRIRPQACRAKAVREFHYRRMAVGYVREYERELGRGAQSRLDHGASLRSR